MTKEWKIRLIAHLETLDNMLRGHTIVYPDIKRVNRELLMSLLEEEELDGGEDVFSDCHVRGR